MERELKFRAWDKNEVKIRKGSKWWYLENWYIIQKTNEHPNKNKRGYVAEHRLIIENSLDRYLEKKEVVHHINNNRADNNLSNLKLEYSHSEHLKNEHQPKRNPNWDRIASDWIFNEIKFRLFNKDNWIQSIFTLSKLISTSFRRGKFEFRGRFTWLKDKNWKEIYEWDIVECQNNIYEVFFLDWIFYTKSYDFQIPLYYLSIKKIIWNIYENKDLLNKQQTNDRT